MLRKGLILAGTVVLSMGLHAQSVSIGLKAGPLLGTTASARLPHAPVLGYTAGIYVPIRPSRNLEVQPEILLAVTGARYTWPEKDPVELRIRYLHVPVSAKLYLDRGFHVQVGVQLGQRQRAEQRVGDDRVEVTQRYHMFDVGLIGGLGLDLGRAVDLSLRYYAGLKPILEDDDLWSPRNRHLQFTVGHRFFTSDKRPVRRRR